MMQKETDVDGKQPRRRVRGRLFAERWVMATEISHILMFDTVDTLKDPIAQVRGPEETDFSRDDSADSTLGKRKMAEREPESPGQHNPLELNPVTPYTNKKERNYYDEMEQDSPSSYPKHVMVPTDGVPEDHKRMEQKDLPDYSMKVGQSGAPLLTPDSLSQRRQNSFEGPMRDQPYSHDMYRAPSYHDVDYTRQTFGEPEPARPAEGDMPSGARPRRWACDYCNVATFLSYEEACAHEEVCARQHAAEEERNRHLSAYGPPHLGHHHGPPPQQQGNLGVLYHASQEVVTPPTPHRSSHPSAGSNRWGSRGPPLPVLPHEHGYYRQGYYDQREDPAYYGRHDQYYAPPPPQYAYGYPPHQPPYGGHHQPTYPRPPSHADRHQKRMLLAMPTDSDSLSDRQCFVRGEMCEIFAATEKDVAARHSKGAQKLVVGQVGIRCLHCAHLRPRDRAERAVCYPSSISRIYQTVADMQRFHFEQCSQIPKRVQDIYKSLKTTRPRGVGSPQAYWVQSAKSLGLVDTGNGIRFDTDLAKDQFQSKPKEQEPTSDMSIDANSKSTTEA